MCVTRANPWQSWDTRAETLQLPLPQQETAAGSLTCADKCFGLSGKSTNRLYPLPPRWCREKRSFSSSHSARFLIKDPEESKVKKARNLHILAFVFLFLPLSYLHCKFSLLLSVTAASLSLLSSCFICLLGIVISFETFNLILVYYIMTWSHMICMGTYCMWQLVNI